MGDQFLAGVCVFCIILFASFHTFYLFNTSLLFLLWNKGSSWFWGGENLQSGYLAFCIALHNRQQPDRAYSARRGVIDKSSQTRQNKDKKIEPRARAENNRKKLPRPNIHRQHSILMMRHKLRLNFVDNIVDRIQNM
jgi:hypothetical protein